MNRIRKIQTFLGLGALLSVAWVSAFAMFSDDATSDASFTSGTVSISASPSTALFTVSDMAPGDVEYAALTISNDGSLELRYDLSTSATDADLKGLAGQIDAEVRKVSSTCDATSFDASVDTIAAAAKLDVLATASARTLASSASEVACYKVSLPSASGNVYQDATTTATFTFDAVQTANNA